MRSRGPGRYIGRRGRSRELRNALRAYQNALKRFIHFVGPPDLSPRRFLVRSRNSGVFGAGRKLSEVLGGPWWPDMPEATSHNEKHEMPENRTRRSADPLGSTACEILPSPNPSLGSSVWPVWRGGVDKSAGDLRRLRNAPGLPQTASKLPPEVPGCPRIAPA